MHTTFTQNVTATGRLSSLNQIYRTYQYGRSWVSRFARFVAPARKSWYRRTIQFELRLAAVLSGDEKLVEDFNRGVDIHTKTAAEAFKVPFNKVTAEQRRAAKVINFGVLYGMSAKEFSGCSRYSDARGESVY